MVEQIGGSSNIVSSSKPLNLKSLVLTLAPLQAVWA